MAGPDRGGGGVQPAREAGLRAQGWERRTVANEPRLSELTQEYRTLGLEVLWEPFDPSAPGEGGCTSCFENEKTAGQVRIIYTRPRPTGRAEEDDLF